MKAEKEKLNEEGEQRIIKVWNLRHGLPSKIGRKKYVTFSCWLSSHRK